MTERVAVSVTARRRLVGVDPARAWAYLADFRHLPRWTSATSVDWQQELPAHGSSFTSIHRLGLIRYRLDNRVTDWAAGHAFAIAMDGLPVAQDAEVTVSLDAFVEGGNPAGQVELRFRATARRWAAPLVRWRARRSLGRSLRRLQRRLR